MRPRSDDIQHRCGVRGRRGGGEGKKKEKQTGEGGIRTPPVQYTDQGYKALLGEKGEEWDKLAQNPFLAFYQRWPWFAQHTPLLNLWNPHVDTVVDFVILFLDFGVSGRAIDPSRLFPAFDRLDGRGVGSRGAWRVVISVRVHTEYWHHHHY